MGRRLFPHLVVVMRSDDGLSRGSSKGGAPNREPASHGEQRTTSGRPVRVLLVADGPEFVSEVIAFFRDLAGSELIGVAPSVELADAYVARLGPDLVLLSLPLRDTDGFGAVRRLSRSAAVVLILPETDGDRTAVRRAGARGAIARGDFVARLPTVIGTLFGTPSGESVAAAGSGCRDGAGVEGAAAGKGRSL